MNKREKMLAIGVASLVGLLILYYLFDSVSSAFEARHKQIDDLNQRIAKKNEEIQTGDRAQTKIKGWQRRSLPSDSAWASSLYQNWLLSLVGDAKLGSATVQQQSSVAGRSANFERYSFQVKGESDPAMKPLVEFLYKFYTSNQLHKIRQLTIKPQADGRQLEVTLDIEALLLPGADRRDQLSQEKLEQLSMGIVGEYEKTIGNRKLFSEYVPPKAKVAETKTKNTFDAAKYATVTGIIEQNDQSQIWVLVKTTGELLKLSEGDEFTVGDMKCKVVKIHLRDAVLSTDGKRLQVSVGDNLRDATPAPAEEL